jgi:hypothetical protein
MTVLRAIRRHAAWVLGAFLIAQAAGIVPLQSHHAAEVLFHAFSTLHQGDTPEHDNDGGHGHAGGLAGECCTVHHHLVGVLVPAFGENAVAFTVSPVFAPAAMVVETASPELPDRPPKFLRSI